MTELKADILIVGGGVGGCAAALAATGVGQRVIMTEPTAWIGGQLTSQATPPDEHSWIESHGCTRSYRAFRDGVRDYYRRYMPLRDSVRNAPDLNPGGGWVSGLCHEPRVALAVLHQMLAWAQTSGRLLILHHHEPIAADVAGDTVRQVTVRDRIAGEQRSIQADYVLDATELGNLLPLVGAEYVTGAEPQQQTGEPHAPSGPAQPQNMQAITWVFAMAYDPTPGADYTISKPRDYERWRSYVPKLTPSWPGPLLSWTNTNPFTMEPRVLPMFNGASRGLWDYRRVLCASHFACDPPPHEITLVNWPQNDYFKRSLIDVPAEQGELALQEAGQLSRCLFYWLQTEAPRHDGDGCGYPELYLRPDVTGTSDGFAMHPYIRESRRIQARFTVTENHIGRTARGLDRAEPFPDSVGIGHYRIDLHPSTAANNYIDIESLPFQIPLGSLIPLRLRNLLAAGKNIGVTHIANGCYRLHPVEWNIGEAAAMLAAYCRRCQTTPAAVHGTIVLRKEFQRCLQGQGIELSWPS